MKHLCYRIALVLFLAAGFGCAEAFAQNQTVRGRVTDEAGTPVVGAGIISDIYLKNMTARFENLRVKSVSARRVDKAMEKAAK